MMKEFVKVVENKNLNISAAFELPDLINLFKTLNVQTGNDISLKYRGDGVQAKLIPEILYFIARKELKLKQSHVIKGEKIKKYFIWGFEEPENSYEYKNLKILADRFVNVFSKHAQIFVTTHSKEFLSLESPYTEKEKLILQNKKLKKQKQAEKIEQLSINDRSSRISLYRVWKNSSTYNASQIVRFSESKNEWENIQADLGIDDTMIIQESRTVENLQKELQEQKEKIMLSTLSLDKKEKIITELNNETNNLILQIKTAEEKIAEYEKICVYFEDAYLQLYKIAFLKLNNIECDQDNFDELFRINAPFVFFSKNGDKELNKFLDQAKIDEHDCKKVIGIFDFDEAYSEFNGLKKIRWTDILGDKQTGFYKKRLDNDNFCSLLLPVPLHRESYASLEAAHLSVLSVELLFEDETLKRLNSWKEVTIPRTSVQESRFSGNKKDFWKKLFTEDRQNFTHFEPLFNKINELFNT